MKEFLLALTFICMVIGALVSLGIIEIEISDKND